MFGVFGWKLSRYEDINSVKGQGIIGESGAGRTCFRVIEFEVPQGATDGSEADNIVYGGFHIDNHCGGNE